VAGLRHSEAPKLISLIRGGLDWIVMKALEKDARLLAVSDDFDTTLWDISKGAVHATLPRSELYFLRGAAFVARMKGRRWCATSFIVSNQQVREIPYRLRLWTDSQLFPVAQSSCGPCWL
jgi:hypothetical protein